MARLVSFFFIILTVLIFALCYKEFSNKSIKPIVVQASSIDNYIWKSNSDDGIIKKGDNGLIVRYILNVSQFSNKKFPNPVIINLHHGLQCRSAIGYIDNSNRQIEVNPIIVDGKIIWNELDNRYVYKLDLIFVSITKESVNENDLKLTVTGPNR